MADSNLFGGAFGSTGRDKTESMAFIIDPIVVLNDEAIRNNSAYPSDLVTCDNPKACDDLSIRKDSVAVETKLEFC
jgi:hypothetical protein